MRRTSHDLARRCGRSPPSSRAGSAGVGPIGTRRWSLPSSPRSSSSLRDRGRAAALGRRTAGATANVTPVEPALSPAPNARRGRRAGGPSVVVIDALGCAASARRKAPGARRAPAPTARHRRSSTRQAGPADRGLLTATARPRIRPMRPPTSLRPPTIIDARLGRSAGFFDWAVGATSCPARRRRRPRSLGRRASPPSTGRSAGSGRSSSTRAPRPRAGPALTQAVIEELEARGCATLVLIATTTAGRSTSARASRSRRRVAGSRPRASRRPSRRRPRPAVRARRRPGDPRPRRRATGEDRAPSCDPRDADPTTGSSRSGRWPVAASSLRAPWGGGAPIAPDPDARSPARPATRPAGRGRARTAIPRSNAAGRERLIADGWTEEPGGTRMIRGDAARAGARMRSGAVQRRAGLRLREPSRSDRRDHPS